MGLIKLMIFYYMFKKNKKKKKPKCYGSTAVKK